MFIIMKYGINDSGSLFAEFTTTIWNVAMDDSM